jgi:hypothetical protein
MEKYLAKKATMDPIIGKEALAPKTISHISGVVEAFQRTCGKVYLWEVTGEDLVGYFSMLRTQANLDPKEPNYSEKLRKRNVTVKRLIATFVTARTTRRRQYVVQRPESSHLAAFVSALLPRLLLDCAQRRIATYVPPAAKSAEGADRGASRIRSGALHIISRKKKLTIRVQNVGQRNCSGLVSPFRKIASPRKRGNFTLQLLEAHSSNAIAQI